MTAVSETAAGAGAPPRLPRLPTRWLILAVICLAQLAVLLDNTILNVAIPSLTRDLGATNADIQWVINAYSLVQAGLLLASGSAADRYGRRKLLLAGLALFGLGSLAAALSQSTAQLTAARGGMGVGGALLLTTTLAVVMQVFDAEERPRAIGIWSAVSALGFAAGPPIGGIMLAHFWWGSIFLLNIPVVVIGLIAVRILVPESKNPGGGPPDLLGALLSAAGMTALVYAIIQMPESGWSSTEVLLPAAAGAAILAAFALWEQHTRHPMLDLHFFRDRRFVGAVSGVVLITFGSAGVLFLLTQQLQFVRGYTPLETGLRMAPFALTIVALNFSGVAFRMGARLGRPASIAAGMTLLAGGFTVVACLTDGGYGPLLLGLLLMGTGCALANPAIVEAVMSAIPEDKAGAGAGIDGTMTEVGTSLGVAVLGAVMNSRFTTLLPATATGAASLPAAQSATHTPADRAAVLDAFTSAIQTSQLAGATAVLTGGCITALLLWRAERG
ncbi:EmrB/QacA subfamily drug resistance transporter [Streptomyces olivoverticillatus]|uniref:EmrB/QacA subfamily drug resistance transporter n=1 Tax=Streptomyces olivoverticillatus TaxID=66427 RepID=A0A7W7LQU7_9ACTN|nr:EmrB/QacA subfamily drug resistance transporter [Streptomyces olivoverticillatus]